MNHLRGKHRWSSHPYHGGVLANTAKPPKCTIEAGVFGGITNDTVWSFQTKAAGPASDAARVVVAADGTGDFCTVQGAIDFVPDGNTQPRTIYVRNGIYEEIVYLLGKHNLTFLGEDRKQTIIQCPSTMILSTPRGQQRHSIRQIAPWRGCGERFHPQEPPRSTTRHARKGGSQAEALRIDGQRCVVDEDDFLSFQDTLKLSGTVFIRDCYIEGDVDFIWGTGTCFFTNCEIKSITSGSCITQIRNTARNNGDVFVDCRLTRAPGVTNAWLSRIDASVYPYSHVAWINCAMDPELLRPVAWQSTRSTTNSDATLRFWEYPIHRSHPGKIRSTQAGGPPNSRQITAGEAAQMRDAKTVLGGWQP